MDLSLLRQLSKHFRQFQFVLRTDSKVRDQFRILVLGIITCMVLFYVASNLIIAPKEKKLIEAMARNDEITGMGGGQQIVGLGSRIEQLAKKKMVVREEIAILKMREKIQRDQWKMLGDPARFNDIIFTMNSTAPVNIDGKLLQMNLGEKRSFEMHEEQPLVLSGKGKYHDVLAYLHYLEISPEIGSINNVVIDAINEKESKDKNLVHFSLLVSRIILKDKI